MHSWQNYFKRKIMAMYYILILLWKTVYWQVVTYDFKIILLCLVGCRAHAISRKIN